ncbi:MAG: hypothetical protein ABFD94_08715 [Armatimonadia bacterium]
MRTDADKPYQTCGPGWATSDVQGVGARRTHLREQLRVWRVGGFIPEPAVPDPQPQGLMQQG